MIACREVGRRAARRKRAASRQRANEEAEVLNEQLVAVMARARIVMSDARFRDLLHEQGIQDAPSLLLATQAQNVEAEAACPKQLKEISLDFVIAWRFFHPLFGNPAAASLLNQTWPDFAMEMKDGFIALVVQGPFPHAMSGYQGRRHGAAYTAGKKGKLSRSAPKV